MRRRMMVWLALLWLVGCTSPSVPLEAVVEQGNAYMSAYQRWDKETMTRFYSPRMFSAIPEEAWWRNLENKRSQLGTLQSFSLMHKSKDTRFSGVFFILQYKTIYEHGEGREIITFVEPVEEPGKVKIFAHTIQIKRLYDHSAKDDQGS